MGVNRRKILEKKCNGQINKNSVCIQCYPKCRVITSSGKECEGPASKNTITNIMVFIKEYEKENN